MMLTESIAQQDFCQEAIFFCASTATLPEVCKIRSGSFGSTLRGWHQRVASDLLLGLSFCGYSFWVLRFHVQRVPASRAEKNPLMSTPWVRWLPRALAVPTRDHLRYPWLPRCAPGTCRTSHRCRSPPAREQRQRKARTCWHEGSDARNLRQFWKLPSLS